MNLVVKMPLTALQMATRQISFIWIAAIIIALSASQDIPRIKNLDCVNDYDTEMTCFWEVEIGDTNCRLDFQLIVDRESRTKFVDNEYHENVKIPNKCICRINGLIFTSASQYTIEVRSHGQTVGTKTVDIFTSVKPKPPSNLEVNLKDPENGVVQWTSNYEDNYIGDKLSYHIQVISKENGKTALDHTLPQRETQYKFKKRQLRRGSEYKVRVRARHNYENNKREIWSEWSQAVTFRNDYGLTVMDSIGIIIPLSCIFIIVVIVSCYFCVTRTKETWWNNIPDPARSKLAQSKLIQKNVSKAAQNSRVRTLCCNLSQLVKAQKKSTNNQLTKEIALKNYQNLTENDKQTSVFLPEIVDVESCIYLYPKQDQKPEDVPEDEEDNYRVRVYDPSIDNMFCNILCDSSTNFQASEQFRVDNFFESFGTSILRDNFQKTERHLPLSMVSQESGYKSYDSDDSPGDLKSERSNPLYSDRALSQEDFLPYAPSQIGKDDVFVNSGYNSFASALAEASSEGDNISVFSSGFGKPYCHHSMQSPKCILYNSRCCNEDELRPMTPTSVHKTYTTSVPEEPGYQSFNQAVHQGDTSRSTCIVFDSGYKPFESLVRTSTSSPDTIDALPEFEKSLNDLVQSDVDLLWAGVVNDGPDLWNDANFHCKAINFYERKYPSYSLRDDHQTSNIQYSIEKTMKDIVHPLALTFDISDHLRNFANMEGSKMSLGSQFIELPKNLISHSLDVAPIIHDSLWEENCLYTDKGFPMKFENLSYFALQATAYSQTHYYLLIQNKNMDKEGNSYMKIAL